MAIYLLNKRAELPGRLVPICAAETFEKYWEPGAKALGLKLVPLMNVLAISTARNDTDRIPVLISELRQLRAWFISHTPPKEQPFLLESLDRLTKALELISEEPIIDISIG